LRWEKLFDPAKTQPTPADHLPNLRLLITTQKTEQGRLAATIVANEADPIALGNRKIDVVEQGSLSHRMAKTARLYQDCHSS
jgi:hypothetical protein